MNCLVRQVNENDCGPACLKTILYYLAGKKVELLPPPRIGPDGMSLLDLKNAASGCGLKSKCVRMESAHLKTLKAPSILHVLNEKGENHFVVCFGAKKIQGSFKFVIGDPSGSMRVLDWDQLDAMWRSKAALIFEGLSLRKHAFIKTPWSVLFSLRLLPKELLLFIPFLSLVTAILGSAISWVIEKGMDEAFVSGASHLLIPFIVLLFLVGLFKCMLAYLKQRILLGLNITMNEKLVLEYTRIRSAIELPSRHLSGNNIVRNGLADIHKIQHALLSVVAVMFSDGLMVIIILGCLFCNNVFIGALNLLYMLLMVVFAAYDLQNTMLHNLQLNEAAARVEQQMVKDFKSNLALDGNSDAGTYNTALRSTLRNYFSLAKNAGIKLTSNGFIYETAGTIVLVLVICNGLIHLQQMTYSYSEFLLTVLLSYFITAIIPRLCNAIYIISEGNTSALQVVGPKNGRILPLNKKH